MKITVKLDNIQIVAEINTAEQSLYHSYEHIIKIIQATSSEVIKLNTPTK